MSVWEWITANKIWLIVGAVAVVVLIVAIVVTVAVHKRKKGLFKFRRYKIYEGPPNNRQQHPKLIIEETEAEYGFMGLTKHGKKGKSNNIPIANPQAGDTRNAYIRKEVRHDIKENFIEGILDNYELSRADIKKVKKYLRRRLKNKRKEEREQRRKKRKWASRNKSKKKKK